MDVRGRDTWVSGRVEHCVTKSPVVSWGTLRTILDLQVGRVNNFRPTGRSGGLVDVVGLRLPVLRHKINGWGSLYYVHRPLGVDSSPRDPGSPSGRRRRFSGRGYRVNQKRKIRLVSSLHVPFRLRKTLIGLKCSEWGYPLFVLIYELGNISNRARLLKLSGAFITRQIFDETQRSKVGCRVDERGRPKTHRSLRRTTT